MKNFIPALVQVDEKDDIITETSDSVRSRHRYYEGKHIINESVESLRKPKKIRCST